MCEVVVGNTSVKVKRGNITTECTDAIVNLNNANLNQNFGVSKEILAAAGDDVQKECVSLGTLRSDEYAVTDAGQLPCKKIIHLVDVRPGRIVESMKRGLKACDEHNLTTVSLPAIGTGAAGLDSKESIKLIFEGLEGYLSDVCTSTNISEITLVVNRQDVYQGYLNFFHNYQPNFTFFKVYEKAIILTQGDITDQSVDCILNLTNSGLNRPRGVSKAILNAAGDVVKDECKCIGSLKPDGIVITSGGNLKSKNIMHIVGPVKLPNYKEFIGKVLFECNKNSLKSLAMPAIGTGGAGIRPQDSIKAILDGILQDLDKSFTKSPETISIVVFQENIYKTYLKFFLEKRTELQKEVENIQVVIKYPTSWTSMYEKNLLVITLKKDCQEYKEVEENFLATAGSKTFTVLEIKRIQNSPLFNKFSLIMQEVEGKNLNQQNVRLLYHGTSVHSIKNINEEGFNRSYLSRGLYGEGSYFAVNSGYSCDDIYSAPDVDGKKYIYQTSVVTGKYCQGTKGMKEPPYIKNNSDAARYDSVTDNPENPEMFVVFYDYYAYPEYFITFM